MRRYGVAALAFAVAMMTVPAGAAALQDGPSRESASAAFVHGHYQPRWHGDLLVTAHDAWTSGDHHLTGDLRFFYYSDDAGVANADLTGRLEDDVPDQDCGGYSTTIWTGSLPDSHRDVHGADFGPIGVDGPYANGSYEIYAQPLWYDRAEVYTSSQKDGNPESPTYGQCIGPFTSTGQSDIFWGRPGGGSPSGTAPPDAIALNGSKSGVVDGFLGVSPPEPVGTARWSVNCATVNAPHVQHLIRQGGISYQIGACAPLRWVVEYVDLVTPDAVTVVKGAAPRRHRVSVPADRLVGREVRLKAAARARLRRVLSRHPRIKGSLHLRVWGRDGAPAVLVKRFVATR
jgi:hypothetical protein